MGKYRLIDLFAGCGAMTRGFVDSGRFEPVLAVESDSAAAATYRANFGKARLEARRIEDVTDFPAVDVVIGGPPCQGFSPLNRARHAAESRKLWREYLRALETSEPDVFVMENVPLLLKSEEYEEFAGEASTLGYRLEGRVLNVADYGVPQRRKRAIAIGTRLSADAWPTAGYGNPALPDTEIPWVTFAEAVDGLPDEPDGENWHRLRKPWPDTIRRYRAVPPNGGGRFEMEVALDEAGLGDLVPACWRKHRNGSYDVFGRLWWDRPATTIRTEFYKPEKGRYLHPSAHRSITVREAARLMSFPDDFKLPEDQSMTAIARQIGNAVPPLLAEYLAIAIADALDEARASEGLRIAA